MCGTDNILRASTGMENAYGMETVKNLPANTAFEGVWDVQRFGRGSFEIFCSGLTGLSGKIQLFWGHRKTDVYESYFEPVTLSDANFKTHLQIALFLGAYIRIKYTPFTETTGTINFSILGRT